MRRLAVAALLLVVVLVGCGGDDDATEAGGGGDGGATAPNTVVIEDIAFKPDELTIAAGDTVTWRWNDGNVVHDVKFDDFRSELQSKGTFEHMFDAAGTYEYTCSVHPQMDATIVVR